jgi:hypothetical protein
MIRSGRIKNHRAVWVGMRLAACIIGCYCALLIGLGSLLAVNDNRLPFLRLSPAAPLHAGHCAFCGMTHSFVALARGEVPTARQYNPMGPALYLVCWIMAMLAAILLGGGLVRPLGKRRHSRTGKGL